MKIAKVVEKYIEKVTRRRYQLKEEAAENRARLFLCELADVLATKGIKVWRGDNWELKIG